MKRYDEEQDDNFFNLGQGCMIHGDEFWQECAYCGNEFCTKCEGGPVCEECAAEQESEEVDEEEGPDFDDVDNLDELIEEDKEVEKIINEDEKIPVDLVQEFSKGELDDSGAKDGEGASAEDEKDETNDTETLDEGRASREGKRSGRRGETKPPSVVSKAKTQKQENDMAAKKKPAKKAAKKPAKKAAKKK